MSIPDDLILKYFELASSKSPQEVSEIARRLQDPATNPSHLKRELARDLVTRFHDAEAARAAEERFNRIHVEKDRPKDVERVDLDAENGGGVWIVRALTKTGLCESSSEARRMVQQGAVRIDGERVSDVDYHLPPAERAYTVKVGKRRFIEILVRPAGR
jgi:tyrosyl-tRNA synthetase